jgi:DNA polymerase-3 subunit beta
MKATFMKKSLIEVLSDINAILPVKTTLHWQKHVLIEAQSANDRVNFYGVNGGMGGLRRTLFDLALGDSPAVISKDGSALIPAKELFDIVKIFSDTRVSLEVDGFSLVIRGKKSKVILNGIDPQIFTKWDHVEETGSFEMDAFHLRNLIEKTAYAVATSETRPTLTGVLLKTADGKLEATATDSHRLSYISVPFGAQAGTEIILPGASAERLAKMLPEDDDEAVFVSFSENAVQFAWADDSYELSLRLLEGKYPDVSRIFPTQYIGEYKVDRTELFSAFRRASTIVNANESNRSVMVTFGNRTIRIAAKSPTGLSEDEIDVIDGQFTEITVSLDPSFCVKALEHMSSQHVTWKVTGIKTPLVFQGDEGDAATLVLPMRTSSSSEEQTTKTA